MSCFWSTCFPLVGLRRDDGPPAGKVEDDGPPLGNAEDDDDFMDIWFTLDGVLLEKPYEDSLENYYRTPLEKDKNVEVSLSILVARAKAEYKALKYKYHFRKVGDQLWEYQCVFCKGPALNHYGPLPERSICGLGK